jgi:hypothetical protein
MRLPKMHCGSRVLNDSGAVSLTAGAAKVCLAVLA